MVIASRVPRPYRAPRERCPFGRRAPSPRPGRPVFMPCRWNTKRATPIPALRNDALSGCRRLRYRFDTRFSQDIARERCLTLNEAQFLAIVQREFSSEQSCRRTADEAADR